MNWDIFHVRRCSSQPGSAGYSVHPFPLLFRHAKIFNNNLLMSFFMSSWLSITRAVNRRLPHITCLIHLMMISVLLVEGLPLQKSSFTSSQPSLIHLCRSKTHVRDLALSLYTCWSISSSCDKLNKKIQVYSFFSTHCLSLVFRAERPKKRYEQKMWKKSLQLYTSKIW